MGSTRFRNRRALKYRPRCARVLQPWALGFLNRVDPSRSQCLTIIWTPSVVNCNTHFVLSIPSFFLSLRLPFCLPLSSLPLSAFPPFFSSPLHLFLQLASFLPVSLPSFILFLYPPNYSFLFSHVSLYSPSFLLLHTSSLHSLSSSLSSPFVFLHFPSFLFFPTSFLL